MFFQPNCLYGLTTSFICSNIMTSTMPNRPCPKSHLLSMVHQYNSSRSKDFEQFGHINEVVFTMDSEVNTQNVICYFQYGQGHLQDRYVGHKQRSRAAHGLVGLIRNGAIFGPNVIRGNLTIGEYLQIVPYNLI